MRKPKKKKEDTTEVTTATKQEEKGADSPPKKKKEVTTEVTSVAKEEEKTGEKINVPSPDELKQRAAAAFITNKTRLAQLYPKLSAKEKNRVMAAILDLPTDGIPVHLKTENEKLCFALGQRMISDRFVLTYFHVVEEARKVRAATQDQAAEPKTEKKEE